LAVNAGVVMERGLLIVVLESVTAPCFRVAVTVLGEGCVCLLVTLKVARNGNLLCMEFAVSLDVGTKLRRGCTLFRMQNPTLLVPDSQYFAAFGSNMPKVSFPRATHESWEVPVWCGASKIIIALHVWFFWMYVHI